MEPTVAPRAQETKTATMLAELQLPALKIPTHEGSPTMHEGILW